MERTAFGGLTETIHIDKISRKDIRSFEVKIEGSEEIIVINTEDDKTIYFIKNNENNDLALEMAKLITRN